MRAISDTTLRIPSRKARNENFAPAFTPAPAVDLDVVFAHFWVAGHFAFINQRQF